MPSPPKPARSLRCARAAAAGRSSRARGRCLLARRELGWSPQLSDLETIVQTAWAWHRRAHPRRNAGSSEQLSAAERRQDSRYEPRRADLQL